ncbi:dephospho-CoA kinase [Sulfurospirillum arcachonense]|uniref:dephospho-CoA kinase n=1 Tax=Sulfurospirillum arcachonense TaxID=57666 RepID=UPI0004687E9D|nr:dephospho-CoA kinase [Sulfurospirillum arcachonense]
MAYEHAYVLTGGIATGKSTVCSLLKMHGFSIIDADVIAKEQLDASKLELKEIFGEEIFENGQINRKKLADIIFASTEQRIKLNNLLHPRIRQEIKKLAIEKDKYELPYIMDIPLYFESGDYECKLSIVVYTPKDVQLERLVNREGLDKQEAQKRVNAQIDIDEKKKRAGWVIDNSSDLKHLQQETEKFVDYIREEYAGIKI